MSLPLARDGALATPLHHLHHLGQGGDQALAADAVEPARKDDGGSPARLSARGFALTLSIQVLPEATRSPRQQGPQPRILTRLIEYRSSGTPPLGVENGPHLTAHECSCLVERVSAQPGWAYTIVPSAEAVGIFWFYVVRPIRPPVMEVERLSARRSRGSTSASAYRGVA